MKSLTAHFVSALALLLVALAVYGSWYYSVAAGSAAVAGIEARINAKTELADRVASARAALAELSGDEHAIGAYFVSESSVVAFIDDLEARGRAQGASVSVRSVAPTTEGAHAALAVELALEGAFEPVMRTVGAIEYAPKYLRVTELTLAADEEGGWRADLSLIVGSN